MSKDFGEILRKNLQRLEEASTPKKTLMNENEVKNQIEQVGFAAMDKLTELQKRVTIFNRSGYFGHDGSTYVQEIADVTKKLTELLERISGTH
jgi:hypothetical protein